MKEPATNGICFYSIATHLGGAERSLVDLILGLQNRRDQKYSPWILLPKDDGPLVDILKKERITYRVLKMPQIFFKMSREKPIEATVRGVMSIPGVTLYLSRLYRMINSTKPEIIHTTGIKCHGLAALVGAATSTPVLWHLRDIMRAGLTLGSLLALRKTGNVRVIANSDATARAFGSGVVTIHNGINGQKFTSAPNNRYRSILNAGSETSIIGIIGVLARWKGQLEFLQMARRLIDQGFDVRFVIIGAKIYDTTGDEDFEAILHEQVKALKLEKHIHFAGFEQDSALAVNGLDIVVHASKRPEPFGRVVVEAMACGVPVVAAADGGVLELIEHERSGLLFKPGSVEQMTHAVSRLVQNHELKKKLVEAGLKRFKLKFSIDSHVDRIVDVYDDILGER